MVVSLVALLIVMSVCIDRLLSTCLSIWLFTNSLLPLFIIMAVYKQIVFNLLINMAEYRQFVRPVYHYGCIQVVFLLSLFIDKALYRQVVFLLFYLSSWLYIDKFILLSLFIEKAVNIDRLYSL